MRRKHGGGGQPTLEEVKHAIEKRLFIGRLPAKVCEADLEEVFTPFGRLTEVRIVESRGVGFVGFDTWAAAHRALLAVDGQKSLPGHTNGQTLIAAFAERTSSVGRGGGAWLAKGLENSRVFVGGLPEDVDDRELHALFDPYGTIRGANLLPPKGHRRCGFVNFMLWGEALDALEGLDRQSYPGSTDDEPLTVVLAEPRNGDQQDEGHHEHDDRSWKRRRTDSGLPEARLARSEGLSTTMDSTKKAEYDRLKVAYLVALDGNEPEQAVTQLHWSLMELRDAVVRGVPSGGASGSSGGRGPPHHGGGPAGGGGYVGTRGASYSDASAGDGERDSNRLFIGGLPRECRSEELKALVGQLQLSSCSPTDSKLLECRVLEGRGCGYLRFASRVAAEETIDLLDNRQVTGWSQPLRARWATPKGGPGGSVEEEKPPAMRAPPASSRSFSDRAPARGAERSKGPRDDDDDIDRKRLFVGQLVRHVDQSAVRHEFERHGEVEEFKVIEEKGVAYVRYTRERDASRAREKLDGASIPGISRGEGLNVQFSKTSKR